MTLKLEIVSFETPGLRVIEFEPRLLVCAEFTGPQQILGGDQKASWVRTEGKTSPRRLQFYPVSPYLLTTEHKISVQGRHTSGEVEYVAFRFEDEVFITVGSDHCDRDEEANSIACSKQLCPKVIARQAIRHTELRPYRGEIKLSSFVESYSRKVPYQLALVADLIQLGSLIRTCPLDLNFNGAVLFSGTVPIMAEIPAFSPHFYFRLELPRFQFLIEHDYAVETLPEVR
jgi:hypothetical protein